MAEQSKLSSSRNYSHQVESDMPSLGGGKSVCKLMTIQLLMFRFSCTLETHL
jgi:hypothetical protein